MKMGIRSWLAMSMVAAALAVAAPASAGDKGASPDREVKAAPAERAARRQAKRAAPSKKPPICRDPTIGDDAWEALGRMVSDATWAISSIARHLSKIELPREGMTKLRAGLEAGAATLKDEVKDIDRRIAQDQEKAERAKQSK